VNENDRRKVVAIAESWVGCPFHDCAALKGVGVDCANLVAKVFEEACLVDSIPIPPYTPHFFLHKGEELLCDELLKYAHEIPENEVLPADLVVYKVGRAYAHVAIVCEWPSYVIHAHKPSRAVIASHVEHRELMGRPRRYFRFGGLD